jgi:hypothetical protein
MRTTRNKDELEVPFECKNGIGAFGVELHEAMVKAREARFIQCQLEAEMLVRRETPVSIDKTRQGQSK